MASLQAKIGWKWMRNRENKNYYYVSFQPDEQQKIPKKFKKIKNTVMYSFQAKIDLKKMRKRENKNYRSVPFLPDAKQKFSKDQQKNSEI